MPTAAMRGRWLWWGAYDGASSRATSIDVDVRQRMRCLVPAGVTQVNVGAGFVPQTDHSAVWESGAVA